MLPKKERLPNVKVVYGLISLGPLVYAVRLYAMIAHNHDISVPTQILSIVSVGISITTFLILRAAKDVHSSNNKAEFSALHRGRDPK